MSIEDNNDASEDGRSRPGKRNTPLKSTLNEDVFNDLVVAKKKGSLTERNKNKDVCWKIAR